MKTKAYSYLRMSTETQLRGDSLRRQLEASQRYAAAHDFELVDSIHDIGVSAFTGKNVKEGGLGRFIEAIQDGHIERGSVLIVESLDRLSRAGVTTAFQQFIRILEGGVEVITLVDNQRYTLESVNNNYSQLFTSLGIMLRANDESVTKSNRLSAAWTNKRRNISAKPLTATVPSWLRLNKDSGVIEVNEPAAKTVRKIFELCIEGMGADAIARLLNANISTYPPIGRASKWNKSFIKKILSSRSVHGFFQPHSFDKNGDRKPEGSPIVDYYPAIISEEDYLLAQARIGERRVAGGGRKGGTFGNIFTKLVQCGNCGATVVLRDKGRPPKGHKYLRCDNADHKRACTCPAWNYEEFEQAFFKFIREIDLGEVFGPESETQRTKLINERDVLRVKITEAEAEYETLRRRIRKPELSEAIADALFSDLECLHQEISKHRARDEQILIELADIESRKARESQKQLLDMFNELNSTLEGENLKIARTKIHGHLRALVSKIVVMNCTKQGTPADMLEEASAGFLEALSKRGLVTEPQIEDFLATEYGRRSFAESLRYFVVHFKSGIVKVVKPFDEAAIVLIGERMATFYRNAKKRSAEQASRARRQVTAE